MTDKFPLILGFISVQTIVYCNFQLYYYYNYINFHNLYQKAFILYKDNTHRCLNGYYSHQITDITVWAPEIENEATSNIAISAAGATCPRDWKN